MNNKYMLIIVLSLLGILMSDEPFNGMTLFTPLTEGPNGGGENITMLMDNDGNIINQWIHGSSAATAPYLMSDSTLICPFKIENPYLIGSAYGGKIIKYSWDGEILWQYEYSDTNHLQHHDIEPMENGNILIISWDRKTYQDALFAGRENVESEMWSDKIVELSPIGQDSAAIVWEWKFWDHLIQDVDSNLVNYGIISMHPELIDINLGEMPLAQLGIADWTHTNSIDYNVHLDQIIISSRNMSEFYIIDHSTTTQEAAGHVGGNSGKGGDILYRWGNPANYGRGGTENQMLVGQHDANWIKEGYPNAGNIIMFNNGSTTGFGNIGIESSVLEIIPPVDNLGNYFIDDIDPFGPATAIWSYQSDFFSNIMSGAKRLPNGNTLVTVAIEMRIFEVSYDGDILWDYTHQDIGQTSISKASKYPHDYLAVTYVDINGDNNVDIFDVILLMNHILELSSLDEEQILLADLNDDGYLTIEDIILLISYMLI